MKLLLLFLVSANIIAVPTTATMFINSAVFTSMARVFFLFIFLTRYRNVDYFQVSSPMLVLLTINC